MAHQYVLVYSLERIAVRSLLLHYVEDHREMFIFLFSDREKADNISIGDKSALKDIKSNISSSYSIVTDVTDEGAEMSYTRDMYEDEYDDTYDTNVVGADDADSADELTNIR